MFDIQQGVSINLFIKKTNTIKDAEILHFDVWGSRNSKYEYLLNTGISDVNFVSVKPDKPFYSFIEVNKELNIDFQNFFSINNLFPVNGTGIVTKRDFLTIDFDEDTLWQRVNFFINNDESTVKQTLNLPPDVRDWRFEWAKKDVIQSGFDKGKIKVIHYRPFDYRRIYYTGNSRGFVGWPVLKIMRHMTVGDNLGLITARSNKSQNMNHFFITKEMMETKCGESTTQSALFPLYAYPDNEIFGTGERKPNLNENIVAEIAKGLQLTFTNEKEDTPDTFAPIDLLDYIYAILHSPTYRDKYKEFLKIDFPRVPYPTDKAKFWQLVKLGGEIRHIHLLESPTVTRYITKYPVDGSNTVEKPEYKDGNVWINSEQYFEGVPEIAWTFYIGGYQPAQKWLKDRKSRELSIDDIIHYQKMIVALTETDRLMKEIDKIEIV